MTGDKEATMQTFDVQSIEIRSAWSRLVPSGEDRAITRRPQGVRCAYGRNGESR